MGSVSIVSSGERVTQTDTPHIEKAAMNNKAWIGISVTLLLLIGMIGAGLVYWKFFAVQPPPAYHYPPEYLPPPPPRQPSPPLERKLIRESDDVDYPDHSGDAS